MSAENKSFYIVISQTGTVLSRILKLITGAEYNHASITFDPDLHIMYSFGRKFPYNPFIAGFVTESPEFGTFKRFKNTKVIVLELSVDNSVCDKIKNQIENMVLYKRNYGYNYLGLYLAAIKIVHKSRNRYYCSEFVREILQAYNIEGAEKLSGIVQPMHFLNLPNAKKIYCGKLREFSEVKILSGVNNV